MQSNIHNISAVKCRNQPNCLKPDDKNFYKSNFLDFTQKGQIHSGMAGNCGT